MTDAGDWKNVGYLNLNYRETPFADNIHFTCPIGSMFCTEHNGLISAFFYNISKGWATEKSFIGFPDFARFDFKMSFGEEEHIAKGLWSLQCAAIWENRVLAGLSHVRTEGKLKTFRPR